jgi:hypothetical protein
MRICGSVAETERNRNRELKRTDETRERLKTCETHAYATLGNEAPVADRNRLKQQPKRLLLLFINKGDGNTHVEMSLKQ